MHSGFNRNEEHTLDCELLVVDETSMIDVPLMHALMKALSDRAALILVGGFVKDISSRSLWTSLQHRLLPHDTWFGVDWRSTAWLPGRSAPAKPEEAEGVAAEVRAAGAGAMTLRADVS